MEHLGGISRRDIYMKYLFRWDNKVQDGNIIKVIKVVDMQMKSVTSRNR
jgi:hypothetical protein